MGENMNEPSIELTAAAVPQGERRRLLTLLFSDLSDSSALGRQLDPEDYAAVLSAVRAACEEVIPHYGGIVVRVQGDGLLAIFGHPQTGEDDARRATEAALDLHERVRALRFDALPPAASALDMHSGIHAGLVLLHAGDLTSGRFELVGDAPNMAAHLSDEARRGEILVSEGTLGAEAHLFRSLAPRRLALKGAGEALLAVPVVGRAAAAANRFEARVRRGLVPFIGRQRELRMLYQGLREAIDGAVVRVIAVSAAPGVGKTRLAEEFLRRVEDEGCEVHRGYCESLLSAAPLQPLLQMLQRRFGLHDGSAASDASQRLLQALAAIHAALVPRAPEFARLLSLASGTANAARERGAEPQALVGAVRALFECLAERRAQLLFIDDWQWSDRATQQMLDAIAGLQGRAIFILTASRGTSGAVPEPPGARQLELAPFSAAEGARSIAHLLPAHEGGVADDILVAAGGNPLYIEELCHSAASRALDRRLLGPASGNAWLNALIESRVARLPPAQAELVRTAAVIGNVLPGWLLEALSGCGPDDERVRGLAEQDFVFADEDGVTLRFKHGITRDVVYASTGLQRRRELHRRIAAAIRARSSSADHEEVYELLAHHHGAAGDDAEAARYAERAGDKAMAASALDRAQAQYRAALEALDRLEPSEANNRRWSAIAQRFGLVCVFDPARDQLAVLRRAVERAAARDDPGALAQAEYWLGYVNYALGESRDAIPHLERATAVAMGLGDDPLLVQVRATLGQARGAVGDYDRALPLLDEGIAVKRRHRSGSRPAVGLSYTLACKAAVLGDRGQFAQAQACFDEALEAVRGAQHEVEASVLGWRSAVYLWQGWLPEALQSALDAQRVAERVKSLFIGAADRSLAAYARWRMDGADDALQTIVDATTWLESRDRRLNISLNFGWLAEAMVSAGRLRETRRYAARAVARARRGDRLGLAMTCRALARASAERHRDDLARLHLERALRAAQARQSPHELATTRLCAAELALLREDRAGALASLDAAQDAFEAMQMRWHAARAEALRAAL